MGRQNQSTKTKDINKEEDMAKFTSYVDKVVTEDFLNRNKNHIFVFGDNDMRVGCGGAAALRHCPNTYGFVTKKKPSNRDEDYYTQEEYVHKYIEEMRLLRNQIALNKDKLYLISRIGAGLANRYGIWEAIIEPTIKPLLSDFTNVMFLWQEIK